MSILKIIPKDEKNNSPFQPEQKKSETLINSNLSMLQKEFNERNMKPEKKSFGFKWKWVFMLSVLSLIGYSAYLSKGVKMNPREDVLFEIKTIDEGGHPIAGALIKFKNRTLGVTDSFGEWRKFYKFRRGSSIKIKIEKKTAHEKIHATKNLVVPLNPKSTGELSVKSVITLNMDEETVVQTPKTKKNISATQAAIVNKKLANINEIKKNLDRSLIANNEDFRQVWFSVTESTRKGINAKLSSALRTYLLPEIKEQSTKLGLHVLKSSPWKINISHVNIKGGNVPGVIRVEGRLGHQLNHIDFLTNYSGRSKRTSKNILNEIRNYVPKTYHVDYRKMRWFVKNSEINFWRLLSGFSFRGQNGNVIKAKGIEQNGYYLLDVGNKSVCEGEKLSCTVQKNAFPQDPPNGKWRLFRLKIEGSKKEQLVYVGGHRASYIGNQVWQYWSRPGLNVFVTMIKGDQSILRKKLVNIEENQVPMVLLPMQKRSG